MPPALLADGVARRYGARPALAGVDLRLEPGERMTIAGPNGAGKTTLIRICAGLLRPNAGSVRVLGMDPRDPRARAKVGLLAHAPFLYGRLTAAENLRFWSRLYGAASDGHDLLAALGIDPSDRRTVSAYSQGMRQRVGIARALVHAPDVLLLDEPFANLDEDGASSAAALIERAAATVLVATHGAGRAVGRVVRLREGRLEP